MMQVECQPEGPIMVYVDEYSPSKGILLFEAFPLSSNHYRTAYCALSFIMSNIADAVCVHTHTSLRTISPQTRLAGCCQVMIIAAIFLRQVTPSWYYLSSRVLVALCSWLSSHISAKRGRTR